MKTENKNESVINCIRYIESCGWKLRACSGGNYYFQNKNKPKGARVESFSLWELKKAFESFPANKTP